MRDIDKGSGPAMVLMRGSTTLRNFAVSIFDPPSLTTAATSHLTGRDAVTPRIRVTI
jgi:hypothetical protein